jgi:hypothetical protein
VLGVGVENFWNSGGMARIYPSARADVSWMAKDEDWDEDEDEYLGALRP